MRTKRKVQRAKRKPRKRKYINYYDVPRNEIFSIADGRAPPEDVAARMAELVERQSIEFLTPVQSYLGDPPLARSALGQRVAALFVEA